MVLMHNYVEGRMSNGKELLLRHSLKNAMPQFRDSHLHAHNNYTLYIKHRERGTK